MSEPLSQHETAAKALESELLSSHTRSDYELIEHEGKMLAKLMFGISLLDKDARRKILGPVLTEFSAEYMEARKAIRGGQDPKTFKFDRRWEALQKGKAPERRPNPPTMDLTQVIKKKAQKPQQEPGPSKPATSQQPPSQTPAAQTTKPAGKGGPKSAAQPSTLQGLAAAIAAIVPPQKVAKASKPPAPKPPVAPKPPAQAPVAKPQEPKAPPKAKKAAASVKMAKGPEDMDVDEPEAPAGRPGKGKGRETDKKRREKGEAAYEPNADSDASRTTDYCADEPTSKKRKAASSKKGGQKKAKSAVIIATDSDVPLVKSKGKATAARASTSTAAVNKTAAKARTSAAVVGKTAAKASTSAAAVGKTAKADTGRPRSNFRQHLAPEVMEQLDTMSGTRISHEEGQAYEKWTSSLPSKYRPIKHLRDKAPRAVVLMGETLTPPPGLSVNQNTCDWCMDFAPMRCFVLDQGTACLMCNIFREKACMLNGEKVNRYQQGPERKGEIAAESQKTGGEQGSATRKLAPKPNPTKKAADPNTSGAKAPATAKPAAKAQSGASTSKLGPISHPTSSADVHAQALDELHATQAKHAASIRAIQSQMDTMALGMAACGSMLKTAEDELKQHATETQELGGMVAERSNALAGAIAQLAAARATNLPTDPSTITHDLIEKHLNNLGELIAAGARFSDLFAALATDVTNTTRALSQWLTGSPDVEMRDREGEDPERDFPIELTDQEGDTYRIYSDVV